MLHVRFIEDSIGNLVDIEYYCGQLCATEANVPQPSAWPGGMETDSDQHCTNCETHIAHGLECECAPESYLGHSLIGQCDECKGPCRKR